MAGAAAAATSVVLASKIGIAGSVIGAAVSSVVTVVSSQIYRHFITTGAEKLKGAYTEATSARVRMVRTQRAARVSLATSH